MEVDVADPPEIIACALSSTQPRIGDRNCYTIKNYPNTVIPYWSIGRYENRQFVDYSSHFFILDAPSEEYFYIVPKFGGKYVIQAKLSIGMGKYETLELEINVPTETVRMPGVVTPWPNDSTYITRVRAYLKTMVLPKSVSYTMQDLFTRFRLILWAVVMISMLFPICRSRTIRITVTSFHCMKTNTRTINSLMIRRYTVNGAIPQTTLRYYVIFIAECVPAQFHCIRLKRYDWKTM